MCLDQLKLHVATCILSTVSITTTTARLFGQSRNRSLEYRGFGSGQYFFQCLFASVLSILMQFNASAVLGDWTDDACTDLLCGPRGATGNPLPVGFWSGKNL